MKYLSAALCSLTLAALASSGHAQTNDGWKYTIDGDTTLATAAYDSGQSIAVRCKKDILDVIIIGLPVAPGLTRLLDVDSGDGFHRQTWANVPDQPVAYAVRSEFAARLLRSGGSFTIRTYPAEEQEAVKRFVLSLPTDRANLDRALAACGTPLEDAEDAQQEVEPPFDAPPPNMFPNLWVSRGTPNFPQLAQSRGQETGAAIVRCVVGEEGRLNQCRAKTESPTGFGFGASAAAALSTARINLGPGVEPGMIFINVVRYQLQ